MMNKNNILLRPIDSVKWSYGYTLILARLLVPSDFGLVAIASLVIAFVEAIREAGFSKAFIQSNDDGNLLFNTVFWMSIITGVFFYLIIFLIAPVLAKLFHSPDSMWVIRIMGIQMILSSLNTCHNSSLIKKLEYKKLFKVNLLPTITPLLITVPLAYIGFNVWALVIGYLASSSIRTLALWYFVPLKPLFQFNQIIAAKILYFGSLCSLEAVLGWFYVWGDQTIVGNFLGATQLGIYSMASFIIAFIFSSVFSPLSISYPLLCGLNSDMAAIRSVLYRLLHIVSTISFLLGTLIFFNVNLIPYLIGEKWIGIELPLGILAITQSLSYIVTIIMPDAFKAINRADIMPKFQSAKLLYTLPAFVAGAKYGGLIGFCYAKLATVTVGFIVFLIMGIKYLDLNWKNLFMVLYPKVIGLIISAVILIRIESLFLLGNYIYSKSVIISIIGIIVYFVVLVILDRRGMYDLIRLTKRVIFSAT
jgi:O-antigen/teichoic acid export membrane protein